MKLKQVKYTKSGKPYVEFKVMSGARKGYVTRRFGKISRCPVCKEKFFARNEQLKRKKGKFCSVRCAKSFAKKTNRKEELASRRAKVIKNRHVYFGDDGKIYTEKKDNKGKVYRYYGELRKCPVCGEAFFADFSQIKLNKAKFCSRQCAKLKKTQPEKENILPKKEEKKPDEVILIKKEKTEEKVEEKAATEEVKDVVKPAVKEEPPVEKTEAPAKKEEPVAKIEEVQVKKEETPAREDIGELKRKTFEEDYSQRYERRRRKIEEEEEYVELRHRPAGVLVFGIVLIYIGIYHLIIALRMSGAVEVQVKNYLITGMNLVLGFGILIMKPWARRLLYAYLIMIVGGAITAYLFTNFVDSTHKALVFSQDFTKGLFLALIPYVFALIYLINPSVKEIFQKLKR